MAPGSDTSFRHKQRKSRGRGRVMGMIKLYWSSCLLVPALSGCSLSHSGFYMVVSRVYPAVIPWTDHLVHYRFPGSGLTLTWEW